MRVLAAESERADDGPIASGVLLHEIREKSSALTHELEEAAARVVVLREAAEVLGEIADPLRQERDLDLRRPGVAVLDGVLGDDLLLLLPRERHSILRHERWRDCIPTTFRPAKDISRSARSANGSRVSRRASWRARHPAGTGAGRPGCSRTAGRPGAGRCRGRRA